MIRILIITSSDIYITPSFCSRVGGGIQPLVMLDSFSPWLYTGHVHLPFKWAWTAHKIKNCAKVYSQSPSFLWWNNHHQSVSISLKYVLWLCLTYQQCVEAAENVHLSTFKSVIYVEVIGRALGKVSLHLQYEINLSPYLETVSPSCLCCKSCGCNTSQKAALNISPVHLVQPPMMVEHWSLFTSLIVGSLWNFDQTPH